MKSNMGSTDQRIRFIVGLVLGGLYLSDTVSGTLGMAFLVVGIVFLATSFIKFCPLFFPFGFSTKSKEVSK